MSAEAALVPYRDARDFVLSRVSTASTLTVPLDQALGKALAGRVVTEAPVPPQPLAGRRGIAVASRELVGASPYSPALLTAPPAAVMPGDTLPRPADAVIEASAATSAHGLHEIGQSAYPGEGAVLSGADCPQGAEIAAAGATATSAVLLAMALAGQTSADVLNPTIRLENPDGAAAAATHWLRTTLEAAGCRAVTTGDCDLRVIVARDRDATASDFGRPAIRGIALNPGRDTMVAWDGGRITILLPARFDAVITAFHGLIAPAIAKMSGRRLRLIARPLTGKLVSQVGFADIALLRSSAAGYEPLATGALPLEALIGADAVGIIEPESEGAPAGAAFFATPLQDAYEPS